MYICTNEPEICGFMTNDCRGGKLAIQKCDRCKDGYLIIKPNKSNGFFWDVRIINRMELDVIMQLVKTVLYEDGIFGRYRKKELSEVRNQPNTTLKKSDIKNNGYLSEEKTPKTSNNRMIM